MDARDLDNGKRICSPKYHEDRRVVDVYRNDGIVTTPKWVKWRHGKGGRRGRIKADKPSGRSLQNLIFALNNCVPVLDEMITLTFHPDVANAISVDEHKAMLKGALQRLRDKGGKGYCWVREYTKAESIHWHIWTTGLGCNDRTFDLGLSLDWSRYWTVAAKRYAPDKQIELERMHNVCARVERIRADCQGNYAAKESAKRFQKQAPEGWNGLAWWRASRNLKYPVQCQVELPFNHLARREVTINGVVHVVAFKHQQGFNQRLRVARSKA